MNLYIIEVSFKLHGQILSQLLKNYPGFDFILYVNLSKDKTYIGYFSEKQIDFNINWSGRERGVIEIPSGIVFPFVQRKENDCEIQSKDEY